MPHENMMMTTHEIQVLHRQGRIYAIKEHRMRTGLGLRESKDVVDTYCQALGLGYFEKCNACGGKGEIFRFNS